MNRSFIRFRGNAPGHAFLGRGLLGGGGGGGGGVGALGFGCGIFRLCLRVFTTGLR